MLAACRLRFGDSSMVRPARVAAPYCLLSAAGPGLLRSGLVHDGLELLLDLVDLGFELYFLADDRANQLIDEGARLLDAEVGGFEPALRDPELRALVGVALQLADQ